MTTMHISISGEEIYEIFGFFVTNTFLLSLVLASVIFFLSLIGFKSAKIVPRGLQNLWELILETFYNFIQSITNDSKKTKEIFPVAATLFILILFSNLLGLIPGVGVFSFLRSPSSDLNFTLALSLFSISYIHFLAIKNLGLSTHLEKFFNFKNPLLFFVGILEGISELTRVFSLAIRLFGNLFAGEVLLIATSFLFAYILPVPFLVLEILVGFIQAFIFSSLVVIFYATAVQHGHQ